MKDRNILLTCCLVFISVIIAGLTIQSVSGAILIDSEDFEAYTVFISPINTTQQSNMFTESGGKWNCSDSLYYPHCTVLMGSAPNEYRNWSIKQESGNNYLSVEAGGVSAGNHWRTTLKWDNINVSYQANSSFTYQFDMRIVGGGVVGLPDQYNYAGIWNGINMGTSRTGLSMIGAVNGDQNYTNSTIVRPYSQSGCNRPDNWDISCSIGDGNWHRISQVFKTAPSACTFVNVSMYIDGNLCDVLPMSSGGGLCGTNNIFDIIRPVASDRWKVDFDDFEIYTGEQIGGLEECSDSIDNDGDGFIDYPDDPSCTSATDDTEAPFDTVQCNDGIDNDGDGFIDYPDDPSCTSLTDDDESPVDSSQQGDSTCTVEQGCLRKDEFSYTDSILLHGWGGDLSSSYISPIYTQNNKLFFENVGTPGISISTNITNPNNYRFVNVEYEFFLDTMFESETTQYSFYSIIADADGNEILKLRHDVSNYIGTPPYMQYDVYYYNGTTYLELMNEILDEQCNSKIKHTFTFDQTLKTFTQTWTTVDDTTTLAQDVDWTNVFASKVYSFSFNDGNVSTLKLEFAMDNLLIEGQTTSESVCDTWTLPYYLKESFNGNPQTCDWVTSDTLFFSGSMLLYNTTSLYQQYKVFPTLITEDDNQFVTVIFDMEIDDIQNSGSMIYRLHDSNSVNFLTGYWLDALEYYYSDEGTGSIAKSNIPLNQSFEYKLIIDLTDDVYDIFFNGTLVVNNANFGVAFFNLHDIYSIKFASSLSSIELDNLRIYASTDDGTPLIPDEDMIPTIINETTFCGLIYLAQPNCIDDSDCESGYCLVNNKCSRWNANYCTEKGWVLGNKCFIAGTASCILTSAGDIVIDNFFLFLVFLVLIMLVVYLTIMFRRG